MDCISSSEDSELASNTSKGFFCIRSYKGDCSCSNLSVLRGEVSYFTREPRPLPLPLVATA